jgi:hypothetical protein
LQRQSAIEKRKKYAIKKRPFHKNPFYIPRLLVIFFVSMRGSRRLAEKSLRRQIRQRTINNSFIHQGVIHKNVLR